MPAAGPAAPARPPASQSKSQPQSATRPANNHGASSQSQASSGVAHRPDSTAPLSTAASTTSQSLSTPQPLPNTTTAPSSTQHMTTHPLTALTGTPTASTAVAHPAVGTIVGACVGAIALVALFIGWRVVRYRRRKNPAVPFPPARPFHEQSPDRRTLARSVYVGDDSAAMSSLYKFMPPASTNEGHASRASSLRMQGSPAYSPGLLPPHARSPTEFTTDSVKSPGSVGSSFPLLETSSTSTHDLGDPVAPFVLSHHSSRASLASSRDSPTVSPVPFPNVPSPSSTPPPMSMFQSLPLAAGPHSLNLNSSSRPTSSLSYGHLSLPRTRPVSYAASVSSRRSVHSTAAPTIRGAPHLRHNRVEIVLPAPLAPELYPTVVPSASAAALNPGPHVRTVSEHSRLSMARMSLVGHGFAWRDEREGTVEEDAVSVRSATIQNHALGGAANPFANGSAEQETHFQHPLAQPPPVPPLPLHMRQEPKQSMDGAARPNTGTTEATTAVDSTVSLDKTRKVFASAKSTPSEEHDDPILGLEETTIAAQG